MQVLSPVKRVKGLLMPMLAQRLLSRQHLLKQRARIEQARRARGEPHRVHYFHQADDPYSALAATCLPQLLARYSIELVPHLVGPPPDSAAPARDKLIAYSRADAQRLACHHGLHFTDPGLQPPEAALQQVSALLVSAIGAGRFEEVAGPLSAWLWKLAQRSADEPAPQHGLVPAAADAVAAELQAAGRLREELGHYLGATFHYSGEWYWGIDRLHHLESRLQELGAARHGASDLMFPPDEDLREPRTVHAPGPIDFFFSLRSPYSAIVASRVFELGRLTGTPVRLRYVLPMVMRGLAVPQAKRMYISQDAAREAHLRGIPFGRICDPVGRPTERGLALMPCAERAGVGQAYVLSFMRGAWAEGIDAGTDRGLRRIAERAGLGWQQVQDALADESWRAEAERNRAEMFALGLWGVPSFRVGDMATWGQDRLWAVREAVLQ